MPHSLKRLGVCRPGARYLRRLENATVSPLCGVYTEALAGAAVCRSLGVLDLFWKRLDTALQQHITAQLLSKALSQWLALRLQLLSAALIASLALMAVVGGQLMLSWGEYHCHRLALSRMGQVRFAR
jgi:hypothetical protein